jgi:SWIM zinc finger
MKTKTPLPRPYFFQAAPADPANPVVGVLDLADSRTGAVVSYYVIRQPDEKGCWVLEKYATQGGDRYVIRLGAGDDSETTCTCRGFQSHGHCKHCSACNDLRRAEKI